MCSGRSARSISAMRRRRRRPPDHAVVVEHGLAVGGEPHVALQPGRPEAHGEAEGLEGVLGGVGPGAPVGEADRGVGARGGGARPQHAASGPGRHGRHAGSGPASAEGGRRNGSNDPGRVLKDTPGGTTTSAGEGPRCEGAGDMATIRATCTGCGDVELGDGRRPGSGRSHEPPGHVLVRLPALRHGRRQAGPAPHRRPAAGLRCRVRHGATGSDLGPGIGRRETPLARERHRRLRRPPRTTTSRLWEAFEAADSHMPEACRRARARHRRPVASPRTAGQRRVKSRLASRPRRRAGPSCGSGCAHLANI